MSHNCQSCPIKNTCRLLKIIHLLVITFGTKFIYKLRFEVYAGIGASLISYGASTASTTTTGETSSDC